jgi:NTP pyrophosphatase (non-canonical NTP hydrolase)
MSNIEELQQLVVKFRDARDWRQFHNAKDMAISLILEASEFLEHFQWKSEDEVQAQLAKNKDEIADELADVLYWVLLIANDFDIDLPAQLKSKIKKNEAKYPIDTAKGNHKKYTEL